MAAKKKAAGSRSAKATRTPARAVAAPPVEEAAPVEAVVPDAVPAVASDAQPDVTRGTEGKPAAAPKRTKTSRYLLPGNMEIAALGPVHAELVALEASNDGPFVLDGAQLSVIDTAGLQLLISFVSAVKSSGKKVSWDNYSVQAYQLANELGVVDQLGD